MSPLRPLRGARGLVGFVGLFDQMEQNCQRASSSLVALPATNLRALGDEWDSDDAA